MCRKVVLCAIVSAALAASGCGGPARGLPVKGTVTMDGAPMAAGSIVFQPKEGGKGHRAAAEIVEGEFAFTTDSGPAAGEYRVEVYAPVASDIAWDDPQKFAATGPAVPPENRVDAEFNTDSTLTATVSKGGAPLAFTVHSAPNFRR